ncbi:UDP-arabinose 4-epimerase 1-like protein, partial [Tanacetum coccineum]
MVFHSQDLFMWFSVKEIRVDVPSFGFIYFDVGVVYKQFSLSSFDTLRDCLANDLGDDDKAIAHIVPKVNKIFCENAFDAVMHFAAVTYVGESTLDPIKYYHNITSNTMVVLEAMAAHNVNTLKYSSMCATYGEPEKMSITEETPQDFHKNSDMAVMILRYFNVIGSYPEGILGEAPRPELREHGRISGACFDASRGITNGLKVRGTDYKTADGTCIWDYIDVTDLVDAHVKALENAKPGHVGIYNVGGRGGYNYKSVRRWTSQRKLGYNLLECDKEQYIVDEVKDKNEEDIDVSSWKQEFVTDLPNQKKGCSVQKSGSAKN